MEFKKSDLKNGMIVKTSGGRYGIVVLKDATCENCIKFVYDPDYLIDDGIYHGKQNISSLDSFDENLNCVYWDTEDQQQYIIYQIVEVFELNSVFKRNNLEPSPNGLFGDIE